MGFSLTPEGTVEVIFGAAARADRGHFVSEQISLEDEPPICKMVHVTFERPAEAHLCTRMTIDDDQSVYAALYLGGVAQISVA